MKKSNINKREFVFGGLAVVCGLVMLILPLFTDIWGAFVTGVDKVVASGMFEAKEGLRYVIDLMIVALLVVVALYALVLVIKAFSKSKKVLNILHIVLALTSLVLTIIVCVCAVKFVNENTVILFDRVVSGIKLMFGGWCAMIGASLFSIFALIACAFQNSKTKKKGKK